MLLGLLIDNEGWNGIRLEIPEEQAEPVAKYSCEEWIPARLCQFLKLGADWLSLIGDYKFSGIFTGSDNPLHVPFFHDITGLYLISTSATLTDRLLKIIILFYSGVNPIFHPSAVQTQGKSSLSCITGQLSPNQSVQKYFDAVSGRYLDSTEKKL
jgi:hypothetical protein